MLRKTILLTLLLSTAVFAHHEDELSTSIHATSGKATHDGDYVNFTIEFKSSCYDQQHSASGVVVNSVKQFSTWLDGITQSYSNSDLKYYIELINTWRQGDEHYGPEYEDCDGKYFAQQYVNITLTKPANAESLCKDLVQDFYNQIQNTLASYWYNSTNPESNAIATAKVTKVSKGIFEDTFDLLRRKAKYQAQSRATNDFLSILEGNYTGWWYLDKSDFSERYYSSYNESLATLPSPGSYKGGSNFVPAQLELKPLSVTAEGTFVFRFERSKNYHGNHENS